MSGSIYGVFVSSRTSGGSVASQTFTSYVELGTPGAFNYPTTGLIRVGSPSVANNRTIISVEPNAGGADLPVFTADASDNIRVQYDASNHLRLSNGFLSTFVGGSTAQSWTSGATTVSVPLKYSVASAINVPLMQDSAATAEGVVTSEIGSLILRRDGQGLDYKVSGTGNTGYRTIVAPIYGSMCRDVDTDDFTRNGAWNTLTDWDGTSGVTAVGVTESKANGTWTVVTTGKYRVTCSGYILSSSDNNSDTVEVQIAIGGTQIPGCYQSFTPTGNWSFTLDAIVNLTAADVVAFQVKATTLGVYTIAQVRHATFVIHRIA
jgi:hypothetical protein